MLEADGIEQEEAHLDRHPHLVGVLAGGKMGGGPLGRGARVALVAAPAGRVGAVADHRERGLGAERVEPRGAEVRPQQEIGLGHVAPAREFRAVDQQARGQRFRVDRAGVAGDVAPAAG